MVDENSTSTSTSIDPNLSPEAAVGNETPAIVESDVTVPTTPTADSSVPRKVSEYHDAPHFHHKWHTEALVDGHDVYHGIVKDITAHGLNFILDHNLQHSKIVKLHIHVPPLNVGNPQHILEVTGKITSSVYDNVEGTFRSSISFIEFTFESDRSYLNSFLS